MAETFISPGFKGRARVTDRAIKERIPPGQYETKDFPVGFLIAFCDGGYTTNLPLADVRGRKAWVVDEYDGRPLAPEHGGPARLLVPHLYFGKARNGCAASNSSRKTVLDSGSQPAITTT